MISCVLWSVLITFANNWNFSNYFYITIFTTYEPKPLFDKLMCLSRAHWSSFVLEKFYCISDEAFIGETIWFNKYITWVLLFNHPNYNIQWNLCKSNLFLHLHVHWCMAKGLRPITQVFHVPCPIWCSFKHIYMCVSCVLLCQIWCEAVLECLYIIYIQQLWW